MIDNEDLKAAQGAYDHEDVCRFCKRGPSECKCRPELLSRHNTELEAA